MALRFAILALALTCAGSAASLSPAERQSNADSFEHVWKTVRDKHWDPKLHGLDWQAIHDELRPKLDRATTMDEARAVMSELLGRLDETHFAIVPSAAYSEIDSPGSRDGNPGIDVRVIEGHALVTAVDAGSPAAARGVKPGWEILRVEGKELAPSLQKVEDAFRKSTLLDLIETQMVLGRLAGQAGKPVNIDFLDGAGRTTALKVDRAQPRGTMAKLGYLPPMYFWVESRKIRPDIGYVRFNLFFEPDAVVKAVSDTVKSCRECNGVVLDLRGNLGGIGGLSMGVAGFFTDKAGQQLGAMYTRDTTIKFTVFPRLEPFLGPLAILVDGSSASTSEILAGGLKDLNRARIFGTRSAGAALPSVFEKLPNGDGFQYAIANYISAGGKPLEALGVIPDEEVKLTRPELLEGRDAVLDAAVNWIEKQKK